jgi:hypothetical protein
MPRTTDASRRAVAAGMLAAGALVAQQVAGRATRDALFLTSFPVSTLPVAMIVAAAASAASVLGFSAAMSRRGPGTVLRAAMAAGTVLLLGEWALCLAEPELAALAVYLHMAVFGGTLVSAFWSLMSERFDPYTAKRTIGPVGLGASLGGVVGGGLAFAASGVLPVPAMLAITAAFNVAGLLALTRFDDAPAADGAASSRLEATGPLSALRLLRQAPYLRDLAAIVALGAAGEAMLDYVLSARAVAAFAGGPPLLSFFAAFHTAVGLLALLVQTTLVRPSLRRLGLVGTAALRPAAVAAAAAAGLVDPRLWSAVAARGAHGVLHNSLFRSGYELLFTPLPERRKRPTKTIVDVGFDRLGTALGGALSLAAVAALGPTSVGALFAGAGVAALAALALSRRLHRGYVAALEDSLRSGLIRLDPEDAVDGATLATLAHTGVLGERRIPAGERTAARAEAPSAPMGAGRDAVVETVAALRSGDEAAIRAALRLLDGGEPALAGHVLPLLGRNDVYLDALRALRRTASRGCGFLVDALLDPRQPPAVRRRVPRILRACATQQAADGLLASLHDPDFELRRQSALALARLVARAGALRPPPPSVFAAVSYELGKGHESWTGGEAGEGPAESAAERGLAHVFTLLALAIEAEPARIAHRALSGENASLRGTALEYLENVLPEDLRRALWPHLRATARGQRPGRPAVELAAELRRAGDTLAGRARAGKRTTR